ncbi:choline transport protein, partial [Lecanoromycetidae sp. Uapishka_2]
MDEKNPITADRTPSDDATTKPSLDTDALALAQMGYTPTLKRNYTWFSLLGVGFSLTNSWWGISAALITGINSGGPVQIVYGLIFFALLSTCVGISLSELASALPNAGGQYFWASELAPRRWARGCSYATGWCAWAGSLFTSASVALATSSAGVGCWQLSHPDFVIKPWHVFVGYIVMNAFAFIWNCYAKWLPVIAQISLSTSLISFFVILVTVPAKASSHQDARFVFANFVNGTGWNQNGIAFIVGLINTNYAFACLDCATHLAEEVHRPERQVPIAIMGTVAIGFLTSWFYSIALFFSMNSLPDLESTPTLVPLLALFNQALGTKAGAIVLEALFMATGIWCLVASHTWQSRLCWSFARDGGLPASNFLSHVNRRVDVPLRAHAVSCVIVCILGCLYLGSYTAFNSMVTACIVLLYFSYAIPVVCLLIRGRDNIRHGPFWLGGVGLCSNVVLLLWTCFTLVMYSFPPVRPVVAGNMNYVSAVYGVVAIIMSVDWFVRGRKYYRGQTTRKEEADAYLTGNEVVR